MKILVIHASAGSGHLKAAEAIHNGLQQYPQHQSTLIDALDYTSLSYKKLYRGTYAFLISRVPWVWGIFFAVLDIQALQTFIRLLRRIYNSINARDLQRFLTAEDFDYIICTHFMPNEVAAALKRNGRIHSKIISVVTDYDVHKIWIAKGIDHYAVASDWTRQKLIRLGLDQKRILVSGIPTDEKFSKQPDIGTLKVVLGLKADIFTILIATGSFGIGPIEQIIDSLKKDFQILVVCGHNKSLFQRLGAKKYDLVKVYGLVDNMHELMAVADVMVTKPGGLSISEALVSQLPLVFFNAIPGQEMNNIKVLAHYGIGIADVPIKEIVNYLEDLRSSKDAFLTAIKKTKELARPTAVRDIISLLL